MPLTDDTLVIRHHSKRGMYIIPLTISRTSTVRLLPPRLARGMSGGNQRPFRVRQVARIAQLAAAVTPTGFCCPHPMLLRIGAADMESQAIQRTQDVRGWTLRRMAPRPGCSRPFCCQAAARVPLAFDLLSSPAPLRRQLQRARAATMPDCSDTYRRIRFLARTRTRPFACSVARQSPNRCVGGCACLVQDPLGLQRSLSPPFVPGRCRP